MRPEIEITPAIARWIQEGIDASKYDVEFDLVCYYVQFGTEAPRPPNLSRQGQRWLKELQKL